MLRAVALFDRAVAIAGSRLFEGAALLLVRLALAGVFWRAARAKIETGTWLTISDGTRFLFENDYSAVPLPPEVAVVMATTAEHVLPVLLLIGLATRFAALGLLGMTMVIQVFVYPEAWWPVHALWTALCLMLIVRGAGLFSIDAVIAARRKR